MCWLTNKKANIKIAGEDILVQKVLKRIDNELWSPVFFSFRWELNKVYSTSLGLPNKIGKHFVIYLGFHSCKHLYNLADYKWCNDAGGALMPVNDTDVLVNAVIPKGAEYYVNEENDYVSNKLKILDYAEPIRFSISPKIRTTT